MGLIYKTENFIVESHEKPEITRTDGGHIKISPKKIYSDRAELPIKESIELMRLTIVVGKAMKEGMGKRGVEIKRINYQENGNWKPHLHIHLYGRAINAKIQKYGDPIKPGNKKNFVPLDEGDINEIKIIIKSLFQEKKYADEQWKL